MNFQQKCSRFQGYFNEFVNTEIRKSDLPRKMFKISESGYVPARVFYLLKYTTSLTLKNGCFLTSSASFSPAPSLLSGFRRSN
jgi:hypothetical protein